MVFILNFGKISLFLKIFDFILYCLSIVFQMDVLLKRFIFKYFCPRNGCKKRVQIFNINLGSMRNEIRVKTFFVRPNTYQVDILKIIYH